MSTEISRSLDELREKILVREKVMIGIASALGLQDAAMLASLTARASRILDDGDNYTMYLVVSGLTDKQAKKALAWLEREPSAGVDIHLLALRSMLHDKLRGRLQAPYRAYDPGLER